IGDGSHLLRRPVECLVPTDAHPAGIRIVLRSRALERVEQPIWRVDQLRRGAALHAERAAGRMRWIGTVRNELAIDDRRNASAAGGEQGTEAGDRLFHGST